MAFQKLGGLPSDVWRLVFPYISSKDLLRLSTLTHDLRRLCLQSLPLISKKTSLTKTCAVSKWTALQTETWGYTKSMINFFLPFFPYFNLDDWRILDFCFSSGDIFAILQNFDAPRLETQLRHFSHKYNMLLRGHS